MTYNIITIGCQMNKSDSERIATYLEDNKYKESKTYLKADLVIINTCGVRQSAEDRVYGLAGQIRKKNKKSLIVVTGCLANRKDVKKRLNDIVDIFLAINNLSTLISKINKQRKPVKRKNYLKIKAKHSSKITAYVPIGNGCNNFCSYCVVPYARGREVYRSAKDIIKEVKDLIKKDYKEIILIAQNVNSYKKTEYDFPKLLAEIASLPGNFWIRFSSSHPKDLSDDLIKVIASHEKITEHLHLALQSGDDDILKKMNRNYKASDFIKIIKKIRKVKPNIAITTDIIVGFPSETKKQYNKTKEVYKKIKFDLAYIAKYSKRPQTLASKLDDDVSRLEKNRRHKDLNKLLEKIALLKNKEYLNKEIRVLIEAKDKKGRYVGKSSSFKTVIISNNLKTKIVSGFYIVKIKKAKTFVLEGIIKEKAPSFNGA